MPLHSSLGNKSEFSSKKKDKSPCPVTLMFQGWIEEGDTNTNQPNKSAAALSFLFIHFLQQVFMKNFIDGPHSPIVRI